VNCNNRHDFPTPEVSFKQDEKERERERKSDERFLRFRGTRS